MEDLEETLENKNISESSRFHELQCALTANRVDSEESLMGSELFEGLRGGLV